MEKRNSRMKRIAFALSLCLIVVWSILGAGTSLAWFHDTDAPLKNIFHYADFDLAVSYMDKNGNYQEMTENTDVFGDDNDFFEPGYIQKVLFKVENKGDIPFIFRSSVFVAESNTVINALGSEFQLNDYLRFGLVYAGSEDAAQALVATRELATDLSTRRLGNYDTEDQTLDPNQAMYFVLIVRMPSDVGNIANYRGDIVPYVKLGIAFSATQIID